MHAGRTVQRAQGLPRLRVHRGPALCGHTSPERATRRPVQAATGVATDLAELALWRKPGALLAARLWV